MVGADFLGQAIIPVSEVIEGRMFSRWLELTDQAGKVLQGRSMQG